MAYFDPLTKDGELAAKRAMAEARVPEGRAGSRGLFL